MLVFVVFNPDGFYTKRIARVVEHHGIATRIVSWRGMNEAAVAEFNQHTDLIHFRTGAPAAARLARHFEKSGLKTLNDSRYIQLSGNKYLANVFAAANNIPTPALNVVVDKTDTELLAFYLARHGALVAKPIISRDMGRYVELLDGLDQLHRAVGVPGNRVLVQSRVIFDRLVRTIVTREGMVPATTFDIVRSGWKATVCENPLAQPYANAPPQLARLATQTLAAFGGDIAYIDFFEKDGEFTFNEINHSCGLMHHERVTGVPIARHLGNALAARYTAWRQQDHLAA